MKQSKLREESSNNQPAEPSHVGAPCVAIPTSGSGRTPAKSSSIIAALTLADTEIPEFPQRKEHLKLACGKSTEGVRAKAVQKVEATLGMKALSASLSSSTSNVAASGADSHESSDTEVLKHFFLFFLNYSLFIYLFTVFNGFLVIPRKTVMVMILHKWKRPSA